MGEVIAIAATSGQVHPLTGQPRFPARQQRTELIEQFVANANKKRIEATYDASRDSDEFKNYWANTDAFDADSAHSRDVRERLVQRSRYEVANNGYADGIAQTYATHLVGTGPLLRMQTGSVGFNRMVENEWHFWCKAVNFRRKLWCMAHSKHVDGESFGVLRRNQSVRHAIKVDFVLSETEQVQTPMLGFAVRGQIDGIHFDEFGNPVYYDILREHPGTNSGYHGYQLEPERVPARFVAHWFKMRRPGQHRGVPECASTLNVGAAARRWREATLAKAEVQADFTLFLKSAFPPEVLDEVAQMSSLPINKRMMTALPNNVEPVQLENNTPGAQYEVFHKQLVNEMARCKSMPYNVAACDSSSYNYSSGRLDHQTYHGALDVDRGDCDDQVLDVIFQEWFDRAVRYFGWLGGEPESISAYASAHLWDWPKHQVADLGTEADSVAKNLASGSLGIVEHYASTARDYEDDLEKESVAYGLTVEQMRQFRLFQSNPQAAQAVMTLAGKMNGQQAPDSTTKGVQDVAQAQFY